MSKVLPTTPERLVDGDVALVCARNAASTGVTFAFSERTGGVSQAPFTSLNMGGSTHDDPACVAENRRRFMAALGAEDLVGRIIRPAQVHGDTVALITDEQAPVPTWVTEEGCDAVVCTAPGVVPMLVFADCVPVVLVTRGGFAVIHSGWRGTFAEISLKSARMLMEATGRAPHEVCAYIGPHIGAAAYEVSADLAQTFSERFGAGVVPTERHLDLSAAIIASLAKAGIEPDQVNDCGLCTATLTSRFFSHRVEQGRTGRHCAVAFMRPQAHHEGS